jgi:hypothetical protein
MVMVVVVVVVAILIVEVVFVFVVIFSGYSGANSSIISNNSGSTTDLSFLIYI